MKSNLPDIVLKYLSKYGSDKWKLESKNSDKYNCAIVVPAIAEYQNIINLLNSLSENEFDKNYKVIIILVINNDASATDEIKTDNQKSLSLLKAIHKNDSSFNSVIKKFNNSGLSIGYVDASSQCFELPSKNAGVGLARKIGMDLALSVFDYSNQEKKILVCLDADCTVEKNYLSEIIKSFTKPGINAAVINYEHPFPNDDENLRAIMCYEIFLRYYELGLKYAGFHYAFQTIGSGMACDFESYIKIEGMNKQKAAEDFYFLEKLAKHYKIYKINSTKVYPSPRKSWRVPFGTGQRINRFFSNSHDEYLLYDPKSFNILKLWLELFHSDNNFSGDEYLKRAEKIHQELYNFLNEQKFKDDWNKILSHSKDNRQVNLQKQRWFDGFKTLKLIHHLRDNALPLVNMFDALDILFEYYNLEKINERTEEIPAIPVQKKYLQILRSNLEL